MTKASPPPGVSSSQFDSASSHVHDECVLCCYPFPLKPEDSVYHACCGELICKGCIVAQRRTLIIGTNVKKPIAGSKEEELEFLTILLSKQIIVCPFCRAKKPKNSKEHLKNLWERIDKYKDRRAMNMLGLVYMQGNHGLSKNPKKAMELYQQGYDLGDDIAAYNLSLHVPDEARRMKCLEEGVKRGYAKCMTNLGVRAGKSGNHEKAHRLYMMAACAGDERMMQYLMENYRMLGSVVSKDDLATTLRAHKAANDTRKTVPREYAKRLEAFQKQMISTGNWKMVKKDQRKKIDAYVLPTIRSRSGV